MKQEIADMKQEIVDMKLEKAGWKLEINMLTFGLQCFAGDDDGIGFDTGFPSHSSLISFYEFHQPSATQMNYGAQIILRIIPGGLSHLPPKFEHIFVAVITFSPILLCRSCCLLCVL